jgi:hypothetical protein
MATSGTSLTPEVWGLIAAYLLRFPDQPVWQPWTNYRLVSRIFKKTIEDHYIKNLIEPMVLTFPSQTSTPFIFKFTTFADSARLHAILEPSNLDSATRYTATLRRDSTTFPLTTLPRPTPPPPFLLLGYTNPAPQFRILTDLVPTPLLPFSVAADSLATLTIPWTSYLTLLLRPDSTARPWSVHRRSGIQAPHPEFAWLGWRMRVRSRPHPWEAAGAWEPDGERDEADGFRLRRSRTRTCRLWCCRDC